MKICTIGSDVGNYDTKTQETTTPSSYKKYAAKNILDEESIYYDGFYYAPTYERNNQQLDKTEDDYCFIITLFGIAKEILYQIKHANPSLDVKGIQDEISKIEAINLGVGLPVGHLSALAAKTVSKYKEKMADGVSFVYRHSNETYTFNFRLNRCSAFAQDFTAVAFNKDLAIPSSYEEYYIIGIGGGTVDIIPVHNGVPQTDQCLSLGKGTTILYSYIIKTIQQETGKTMEYSVVEAILRGKNTIVDEARKSRVLELADEYANKLVDELAHAGLSLSDKPCVFVGGGALLFKSSLEKNSKIVAKEFIDDVNINAKYYAEFV